jgi:hypothetical protein
MTEPYIFREFMEALRDGMTVLDNEPNGTTKLVTEMNAAGFLDVIETHLECPVGIWSKDRTLKLGRLVLTDGDNGWLEWSGEQVLWEAIEVVEGGY